jgi:UDP-N-acetylglucosamine 2-epimerase (non-hydrolysing)
VLGTRPELIRLSEIIKKLDKYTNHILVHTNQNYDYEMNQIFFEELKIRKPDYVLNVKAPTVGEQIGNILTQTEQVMLKEKPDAVFILGDTNSALSCYVAKRLKIVVFHLEAGNRCFDSRVPEEINRRIVDHTSDINMCYSENARRNLLDEGLKSQNIFVVGSPLTEVYAVNRENIGKSRILDTLKLEPDKYIVASIHREENINGNLLKILKTFCDLSDAYKMPVIFSTHPRIKQIVESLKIDTSGKVWFYKPFGMFDYIRLQKSAFVNLSDSGTIHEDAAILGINAVHIRESNERPEVYDSGNVVMSGIDESTINDAVKLVRGQIGIKFGNPYGYRENTSDRVVRLIIGQHKIVAKKEYYL